MSEVNVQKSAGCNEIKINVKPVPVNPVVLENSYRGIDYNVLKHKPQIEGNELIGNKTAKNSWALIKRIWTLLYRLRKVPKR